MDGLGFSSNRRPFIELASQVRYQVVVEAAGQIQPVERLAAISGWLSACSGFVERESPLPRGIGLATNIRRVAFVPGAALQSPAAANHGSVGTSEPFLGAGTGRGPGGSGRRTQPGQIDQSILSHQQHRPAFGGSSAGQGPGSQLCPALHARLGGGQRTRAGSYTSIGLYHWFPLLAANEVTREMAEQLLPAEWLGTVANARRQQGLLHLLAFLKGTH